MSVAAPRNALGKQERQALSTPDAFATWVEIASISAGRWARPPYGRIPRHGLRIGDLIGPVADRMRSYRRRLRHGVRCIQVQVGRAELDGLVAKGYLPPRDRDDITAIAVAIDALMFDWLNAT
jgi:hypothetical protein